LFQKLLKSYLLEVIMVSQDRGTEDQEGKSQKVNGPARQKPTVPGIKKPETSCPKRLKPKRKDIKLPVQVKPAAIAIRI